MTKMTQGQKALNAIASGQRAEIKVERLFGLDEPYIEIKACCWEYYRVVIKSKQLGKFCVTGKTYCIVLYSRGNRGKIFTLEQAFEERELKFYFIEAAQLMQIIKRDGSRHVKDESHYNARGESSFYHVKISSIKEYLEEEGHKEKEVGERVKTLGIIPPQEEVPF